MDTGGRTLILCTIRVTASTLIRKALCWRRELISLLAVILSYCRLPESLYKPRTDQLTRHGARLLAVPLLPCKSRLDSAIETGLTLARSETLPKIAACFQRPAELYAHQTVAMS